MNSDKLQRAKEFLSELFDSDEKLVNFTFKSKNNIMYNVMMTPMQKGGVSPVDNFTHNDFSATSDASLHNATELANETTSEAISQTGGNIFRKNNANYNDFSATSGASLQNATELANETTSEAISQTGGNIFSKNNVRSDGFSATSEFHQSGGGFDTSDTLKSVSELRIRRKNRTANLSETSVDLNIFKRGGQSGGSMITNQKMKNIGINSSSTSDLCE